MKATAEMRRVRSRLANRTRFCGPGHPETLAAARQLAALQFAAACTAARRAGFDELDLVSIARTGQLPAQAEAA